MCISNPNVQWGETAKDLLLTMIDNGQDITSLEFKNALKKKYDTIDSSIGSTIYQKDISQYLQYMFASGEMSGYKSKIQKTESGISYIVYFKKKLGIMARFLQALTGKKIQ
jgi:hypothetical protein